MASIHKRSAKSKFWTAAFTSANGQRLKRSTKCSDRKMALKIANGFEEAATKQRTALQVRRVVAQLSKELTGQDMAEPTVREHVQGWLASKSNTVAPATLTFYRNVTVKFLDWLKEQADREISLVTGNDLVTFRNARAAAVSAKTVNHEIKALRMIFKAARKDGLVSDNPAEFVETLRDRGSRATRQPFTVPQLQAVLEVCAGEWRSLVLFGLYTGQRLGDLASLRWSSIDTLRGEIRLVTGKTGRQMIIPIAAPLLRHLETLDAGDDPDAPVHPQAFAVIERTGKTGGLSNQFIEILAKAGLRARQVHRKNEEKQGRDGKRQASGLSFHSLRHTAVSMMKDAGIPAAAVMELIGHDSEQMSQHYTHTGKEALERAAAALPDLAAS